MCDPVTMTALAVGSTAISAYGQIRAGQAASASANYNAQMSDYNAKIASQNQQIASEAGMAKVGMQGLENRAKAGQTKANQASSGVSLDSGSFVDVAQSEAELGMLDALQVRSNATREAYGYQVQETDFKNNAALSRAEGENAKTASYIGAGSTILGGASNALGSYQKYQKEAGIGSVSSGKKYPRELGGA